MNIRDSKKPLYRWVEERLRNEIHSGAIKEGELIPTETELAQKYGVSQGTARRAVLLLKEKGLLYRVQKKGTSVVFQETSKRRLRNYRFVERVAVAPDLVSSRVYFLGLKIIRADDELSGRLNVRRGSKLIRLDRMGKISEQFLLQTVSFLPKKLYRGLEEFTPEQFVKNTLWKLQEAYFGLEIKKREEFISVVSADEEMAGVLDLSKGTPILRIETLLTTTNGEVAEYRLSHCDTGHLKFYVSQDSF